MKKQIIMPIGLSIGLLMGNSIRGQDQAPDPEELRRAVTLYASFDQGLFPDRALGKSAIATRFNHPKEKGKFEFVDGYDPNVFRIAKGKGIKGGALEAVDVLPNNGRIFYQAKGNLAFKKGGWGGAVSCWINTDPDQMLKTQFCDPIQITEKGATNGGIWFDFNNAKPREMRMGVFPAIPAGQKGILESDPDAPMVRIPKPGFKQGTWQHVVLSWQNFDTGKTDARAVLYVNGQRIGEVKDRPIAMDWDIERAGIYFAVNYMGLLDDLVIFNRPVSEGEVRFLHKNPGGIQ
jgi:hypothetical protein